MPTETYASALLEMAGPDGDAPWTWPTWQAITGIDRAPWTAADDPPAGWSSADIAALQQFVKAVWLKPDIKSRKKLKRPIRDTSGNDSDSEVGRVRWTKWVGGMWGRWKINILLDRVLEEHAADPYSVMRRRKINTFPDLAVAQLGLIYPQLAIALFGDDAFEEPNSPFVLDSVRRFLDTLMAISWNRYRKSIKKEKSSFKTRRAVVDALWKDLADENKRPTAAQIKKYLSAVEALVAVLKRYGDDASVQEVQAAKERLMDMLATMGIQKQGSNKMRIPKALRDALELLASQGQVDGIMNIVNAQIAQCAPSSGTEDAVRSVDLDDDEDLPVLQWQEGVEAYRTCSMNDIWGKLGFPNQEIPLFNIKQDPQGMVDAWATKGVEWLEASGEAIVLKPRWHQLVGILQILHKMMNGESVLLMDEVGVGKTLQAIGVIAVSAFYREYYACQGKFPGEFAKIRCKGTPDGNLPDLPNVIACPANLQAQLTEEIHRFLKKGAFDLLPYTGTYATRKEWWSTIWTQSKQPLRRKILLTTIPALQSDGVCLFSNQIDPSRPPRQQPGYVSRAPQTIFGQEWGLFVMDEAHVARTCNKAFTSAFALRLRSKMMVAMTATPIQTRPMDLWNLGRLLGLPDFIAPGANKEATAMDRELKSTLRKERKKRKESKIDEHIVRGIAHGVVPMEVERDQYKKAVIQWINTIRDRFAGAVIRRTVHSVDNYGNRISGLADYIQHPLIVEPYDHEKQNMDDVAEALLATGQEATSFGGGIKTHFYLRIRRAITHPACNPDFDWHDPQTVEDWLMNSSVKLDSLVQILQYHLSDDGRQPLMIGRDGVLVPDPRYRADIRDSSAKTTRPDKIVIFGSFPSNNELIKQVLRLYEFTVLELNGEKTLAERNKAVKAFRDSQRDGPRILLLSAVGMVGLNLAFANYLVILDTLWSAQEDGQLIGRIWRQPQDKQVHVYRLIAGNTSDVFLNNISFDKASMHEAFTGSSTSLRKAFSGQEHAAVKQSPEQAEHSIADSEDMVSESDDHDTKRLPILKNAKREHTVVLGKWLKEEI